MGVLINGIWRDEQLPQEIGRIGDFRRADSSFRDHITVDGSSGFKAEAGRYHLYVAHGCPWAHRTLIYRALTVPGSRCRGDGEAALLRHQLLVDQAGQSDRNHSERHAGRFRPIA